MSDTLPPLPEPRWNRVSTDSPYTTDGCEYQDAYSEDQMRSYASAAVAAAADEIERLTAALAKANSQAEHFEREWYLRGDEVERLAAPAAPPQREPLTDEQIDALWDEWFGAQGYQTSTGKDTRRKFARCVEAAHGITARTEPLTDEEVFSRQDFLSANGIHGDAQ